MLAVINIILLNNKVLEYKMVNIISEYVGNLVSSNTSSIINVHMIDIEISCRIIYVNHIYIFYKKRQSRMKQIFWMKLIAHKNDTRINRNTILHCYHGLSLSFSGLNILSYHFSRYNMMRYSKEQRPQTARINPICIAACLDFSRRSVLISHLLHRSLHLWQDRQ